MTHKSRLIIFTLLLTLLTPLCAQAQEDVTLTLWTHDGLYVDYFGAAAQRWAAENYPDTNFTFDFQVVPDVDTVVLANLAAGEPIPDILGIEQGQFPRYMRDGLIGDKFVELTERIGSTYDQIPEGRWTLYNYDRGIYGVDSSISSAAYYYQPDIFEDLGIDVPTTWEAFVEAGATASESGVALGILLDSAPMFEMYFHQRGGQMFDAEGNFVLSEEENRQVAIDVLNMWRAGLDSGAFTVILASEFWGPTTIQGFESGSVAGAVMPDWYGSYVIKPQAADMAGEWRVAPMPVWADGVGSGSSVWGGTGFAVSQDSEHVDLAWELIEYAYLTYEGQVARYEEIGYYPTMTEAFQDEQIVGVEDPYYGGQKVGEIFADTASEIPVWYQSSYRADALDAINERLPLFFDGGLDAETLVDEVIFTVEDEIAFDN